MAPHTITVSIGGGLELDRAGLAALIAELPGLRLIPLDRDRPPQVLVWQGRGAEADYLSYPASTAVLLVSEELNSDFLPNFVRGILSKAEPAWALGTAIRQIARGEQYLSPTFARTMLEKHQRAAPTAVQEAVLESLTDREREILHCLAEGLSNKAIAARLYLSVRTVEGHLASIYNRLGVHTRTEAMLLAVKSGSFT